MVGPSSQISKLLLSLLFLLIIFYIYMDVQLYLRIQNYPIERIYYYNVTTTTTTTATVYSQHPQNQNQNLLRSSSALTLQKSAGIINNNGDRGGDGNDGDILDADKYEYKGSVTGSGLEQLSFVSFTPTAANNYNNNNLRYASSEKTVSSISLNYNNNNKNNNNNNPSIVVPTINQNSYEAHTWITCDINPLCHVTVKAILLDHTNHYIFAPLAIIFDNIVGFSRSKFITANMISYFHVFVACAAGRLIASDSLYNRRIGVVLFQFRTFLDDLDGYVARTKKHIRGERSLIGTAGYYIDGICDGLGCIALIIGITYFLKNNPPRRGYTQLQAVIPIQDIKNPDCGVIYKIKITTKKVAKKVLCFSGQLLLSSTAWNRYIALYQDMLERDNVTNAQYIKQNIVFKSNWFFFIAWLWRIFNVHSLLHCVLLSIFCDKLWDFLRMVQYIGFIILLIAICATEMHILEVHNFIFNSLTGNYTSL